VTPRSRLAAATLMMIAIQPILKDSRSIAFNYNPCVENVGVSAKTASKTRRSKNPIWMNSKDNAAED
jgi:hypothetical protein